MNKKILIPGIVVLIVGILLITLGFTGIVGAGMVDEREISNIDRNSEYEQDVENEVIINEEDFQNYTEGDRLIVSGEIMNKVEDPSFSQPFSHLTYDYRYTIADEGDSLTFHSNKDVGDEGDDVTVTLEVQGEEGYFEREGQYDYDYDIEYMELYKEGEPVAVGGIPIVGLVGILVLITGAVISVLGITKESRRYGEPVSGGTSPPPRGVGAQEPAQQPQQQPRQQAGAGDQTRQQPAQQSQQKQQVNTCPDCGQQIRYVEEYDRWYCDSCQEYK